MRRIPTILHEHANLTDTPWFQKVADRALEPLTDIAIAVSESTAEFVIKARQIPAEKVKVVYLGVPLEEFSRAADRRRDRRGPRASSASRPDEFADRHGHAAARVEGQLVSGRGGRGWSSTSGRGAKFFIVGEGPLREPLEQQARALGLGDRFVFAGFARDVARVVSAFDVSVFPSLWEGTPLTVFEALAMGQADRRDRRRRPARRPDRRPRRASSCRSAMPRRWRARSCALMDEPETRARLGAAARVSGQQYDIAAFVRKMERLYDLLHRVSRATHRKGAVQADLSFLDTVRAGGRRKAPA